MNACLYFVLCMLLTIAQGASAMDQEGDEKDLLYFTDNLCIAIEQSGILSFTRASNGFITNAALDTPALLKSAKAIIAAESQTVKLTKANQESYLELGLRKFTHAIGLAAQDEKYCGLDTDDNKKIFNIYGAMYALATLDEKPTDIDEESQGRFKRREEAATNIARLYITKFTQFNKSGQRDREQATQVRTLVENAQRLLQIEMLPVFLALPRIVALLNARTLSNLHIHKVLGLTVTIVKPDVEQPSQAVARLVPASNNNPISQTQKSSTLVYTTKPSPSPKQPAQHSSALPIQQAQTPSSQRSHALLQTNTMQHSSGRSQENLSHTPESSLFAQTYHPDMGTPFPLDPQPVTNLHSSLPGTYPQTQVTPHASTLKKSIEPSSQLLPNGEQYLQNQNPSESASTFEDLMQQISQFENMPFNNGSQQVTPDPLGN